MATVETPPTGTTEVSFPVTGMTCASCVRRIEKALGRVEGVQQANVNLATEKASVTYDPRVAAPEALKAAVEKAGYGIRDFPVEVQAPTIAPAQTSGDLTLPIRGKALGKGDGVSEASVNL